MKDNSRTPATLTALIRSGTVKAMFDGISDMTLWRWVKHRNFPEPTKLNGRNYWDPIAIARWREVVHPSFCKLQVA